MAELDESQLDIEAEQLFAICRALMPLGHDERAWVMRCARAWLEDDDTARGVSGG